MAVRLRAGAAVGGCDLAGDGEHGVADLLGIEAARGDVPEQAVLGIGELRLRGDGIRRGLHVGRAGDDEAVELLETPSIFHEPLREPVEQLGVRGLLAERAEVARIHREAVAEVELPHAVHDDARGERILRLGEPACERAAAARAVLQGLDFCRGLVEHGEEAGRDFAERLLFWNDYGRCCGPDVRGDRRARQRLGFVRAEFVQLGEERVAAGFRGLLYARVEAFVLVFITHLPPREIHDLLLVRRAFRSGLRDERLRLRREFFHGLLFRTRADRILDVRDFFADVRGLRGPRGIFLVVRLALLRRCDLGLLKQAHRREERLEAEVVLLQDGIELVVVAARALHAHAHEDIGGRVGDVVEHVHPLAGGIAVVVFVDAEREVAGGDACVGCVRPQFVAGDLLLHEAVVGFVGIQARDDVVAVAPRVRAVVVGAEAVALGVAHEVEPMPRPVLAVARAGEEPVHELAVRAGRHVGCKCSGFLGLRRQARQIEINAADECGAWRCRRGPELRGVELCEDEAVDRIRAPSPLFNARRAVFLSTEH